MGGGRGGENCILCTYIPSKHTIKPYFLLLVHCKCKPTLCSLWKLFSPNIRKRGIVADSPMHFAFLSFFDWVTWLCLKYHIVQKFISQFRINATLLRVCHASFAFISSPIIEISFIISFFILHRSILACKISIFHDCMLSNWGLIEIFLFFKTWKRI